MKSFFIFFFLSLNLSSLEKTFATPDKSNQGAWSGYFQSQKNAQPHDLVTKAFKLIEKKKNVIVIDLGTGNGKDISDILKAGAIVYAYDADPGSTEIIHKRFKSYVKNKKLLTHQILFEEITSLPKADMIIFVNSLPFMKKEKLLGFWKIIQDALNPNGIFIGTFFGEKHYAKRDPSRPEIFRVSREEVFNLFTNFQILNFYEEIEYDEDSSKSWKTDQFHHVYKVIARKKP